MKRTILQVSTKTDHCKTAAGETTPARGTTPHQAQAEDIEKERNNDARQQSHNSRCHLFQNASAAFKDRATYILLIRQGMHRQMIIDQ